MGAESGDTIVFYVNTHHTEDTPRTGLSEGAWEYHLWSAAGELKANSDDDTEPPYVMANQLRDIYTHRRELPEMAIIKQDRTCRHTYSWFTIP